jgi:hypothetical protein
MMTSIAEIVLIAIVAAVFLGMLPLAARTWMGRLRTNAEAEVRALGGPVARMDPSANLAGVSSRGRTQLRGNGCLAIVGDELVFVQWVPRRALRVPLASITEVGRVNSWLGKVRPTPMLEVRWNEDSAAWWVADLPSWEAALRTRFPVGRGDDGVVEGRSPDPRPGG